MKSYLTFLSRNKLYSAIQAFGLSVSLGFVILLTSYAHTEFTVASDQPLYHDLYVLGAGDYSGMTLATAEEFFPSVPEIKRWTRYVRFAPKNDVTVGTDYYETEIAAMDTNFLAFFNYKIEGCPRERILAGRDDVLLSQSFARKAFGNENPVGRTLMLNGQQKTVTGILEDFTPRDIFKPADLFLSMEYAATQLPAMDNFGSSTTFLTLTEGADKDAVAVKLLDKYVDYWPFYSRTSEGSAFLWGSTLTPLDEFYFSPIESDQLRKGDRTAVNQLLIVVLVLLLSAIFNYINLTVAQTGKRSREMAMRKLLGETGVGIIWRYFRESALFTLCCLVAGWGVACLFRPFFEETLQTAITLSPVASPWLLAYSLLAVLLIGGLCSIMPSVLTAGFTPMDVVKGEFRLRSKMTLSKLFLVVQHIISTCLVAVALTMLWQMHYLTTLPTGYTTEDIVMLYTYALDDKQPLLQERLMALPQVKSVGMCGGTPIACSHNGVTVEGDKHPSSYIWLCMLDTTAFHMLGFHVVERYSEPLAGTIWLTEEGKHAYGLSPEHTGIGGSMAKPQYDVCGIVADYRGGTANRWFDEGVHNAIQIIGKDGFSWMMLVKTRGDHAEALKAIRDTYSQTMQEVKGVPKEANARYMDEYLYEALKKELDTTKMVLVFTAISLLISALGLLAMALYHTEQQRRSIALRRVMGASVKNAFWQIVKRFLLITLVAILIATPLSVWLIRRYLEDFPLHIAFPWPVLLAAALFSLLVAVCSIIGQSLRVALDNPVKSIHAE